MGWLKVLDLSQLTEPIVWYVVLMFVMTFPLFYVTKEIFFSIVPAIALTMYLSLGGYLPLWYGFVVMLIIGFMFVHEFILPIVKNFQRGD